ncbi:GNAT family N-acetyltransferase [Clostridium massiliodielmoense]|uniref:GNAT family N-acetyltransferase n=1 Tax=Clostridium massiliodielmoense TaxID=1776385 RepID=UPI00065DED88|nr:GNAT family N-acetyltransferase [Clostridium massiliodielmoense]
MIKLRKVNEKDCDVLFEWANDIEVRKNSFNANYITYEEHVDWFLKVLENGNVLFFIMEVDNKSIGQIRINIDANIGIISYSIYKEFRGKGFGEKIIQLVEEQISNLKIINKIVAYVKKDNTSSNKIFTKLNYLKEESGDSNLYYKFVRK